MREIIKGYRWWILGLLFCNVAIGMISYEILSPLFGEVSGDIALDPAQFGLIMGLFHFASPFFTPIGGIFVDKIGARKVLLFALILLGVAGAARTLATEPWMMMLSTFLMGCGFASVGPSIPKALSGLFDHAQLGKATGFVFSAFGLGNSFALATGASVLSPALGGWRPVLITIALACFVLGIIWYVVFRDDEQTVAEEVEEPEVSGSFFDGAAQVIKVRNMWFLSIGVFFSLIGYWGLVVHLAPMLDARGLENFGAYAAVMTGTGVLFNLVGGAFSDWLGKRKPVLMGCVILLACTIPGMLYLDGWLLVVNMVFAGVAMGPILPMAVAMPVEFDGVGHKLAGTAIGVMFMFGNIGAVLGPILLGNSLTMTDTLWHAFALPIVSLFLATIPLSFIKEHNFEAQEADPSPA